MEFPALIDTGASLNYLTADVARLLQVEWDPSERNELSLAYNSISETLGTVDLHVKLKNQPNSECWLTFDVIRSCPQKAILGLPFSKAHHSIKIPFYGRFPTLDIFPRKAQQKMAEKGSLGMMIKAKSPTLFYGMQNPHKPIKQLSKRFSTDEQAFIKTEVDRLLKAGKIRKSFSAWRSQVEVIKGQDKWEMAINYTQTVNKRFQDDIIKMDGIDETVEGLKNYKYFARINFRDWHHIIQLHPDDIDKTAFEADQKLYEFSFLPEGLPNVVGTFERAMKFWINARQLKDVHTFRDEAIVGGYSYDHYKEIGKKLEKALAKEGINLKGKVIEKDVRKINILGFVLGAGKKRLDFDRLKPLFEMRPPGNVRDLRSICGIFGYYKDWIEDFAAKISPLKKVVKFPIHGQALRSFHNLKEDLNLITLNNMDDEAPFTVETDASSVALSATLNQFGKPFAFFSEKLVLKAKGSICFIPLTAIWTQCHIT